MSTMRDSIRAAAEDYKGLAALAGAAAAGGLFVAAATGFITLPGENQEAIEALQTAMASSLEVQAEETAALQDQVDAVVEFVRVQSLLNCTLTSNLTNQDPAECSLPSVLPRPGGLFPPGGGADLE